MNRKTIESWLKGLEPKHRRLFAVLAALGALLIAFSSLSGGPQQQPVTAPLTSSSQTKASQAKAATTSSDRILNYADDLDHETAQALSGIRGAGTVSVHVMLAGSPALDLAQNDQNQTTVTTQRDAQGGTQTTTSRQNSSQVVTEGNSPVITSETSPKIVGVLVVATGATDPVMRQRLTSAAEVLLGLKPYAVTVLPKEAGSP